MTEGAHICDIRYYKVARAAGASPPAQLQMYFSAEGRDAKQATKKQNTFFFLSPRKAPPRVRACDWPLDLFTIGQFQPLKSLQLPV